VNITKWDAGTWIAVAGAVIALVAALAAGSQARSAKRSAKAADDQVAAARAQVAIMQQQLSNEAADRHEAAGPVFGITESWEGETPKGQRVAEIIVMQEGGPGLSRVTVTTEPNEYVRGLIGLGIEQTLDCIVWDGNAPGTRHQVVVSVNKMRRSGSQEPGNVVLHFESVGVLTGATWERTKSTTPKVPFHLRLPIVPGKLQPGGPT
jgi:hypothetical protein